MEDNLKKINFIEKLIIFIKEKKNFFVFFFLSIFILLISYNILNIYKDRKNKKISDQYIQAGILLAANDIENSKRIFKEIIFSKNKFYSFLSLNTIIEKNLEENEEEVLKLFNDRT